MPYQPTPAVVSSPLAETVVTSDWQRRLPTLKGGNHLVLRRLEAVSCERSAIRDLRQRQILGKARCGIFLGGTLQ